MNKICFKITSVIVLCSAVLAIAVGSISLMKGTSEISNEAKERLLLLVEIEGKNIEQEQSYVAGNNVFCVYNAESEDVVKEHAERAGVPVNDITLVSNVLKHNTNN